MVLGRIPTAEVKCGITGKNNWILLLRRHPGCGWCMMCSTAHNVLEVHLGLNATLIFSCMMMMMMMMMWFSSDGKSQTCLEKVPLHDYLPILSGKRFFIKTEVYISCVWGVVWYMAARPDQWNQNTKTDRTSMSMLRRQCFYNERKDGRYLTSPSVLTGLISAEAIFTKNTVIIKSFFGGRDWNQSFWWSRKIDWNDMDKHSI